jgi:hypothetical protein
MNPEGQFGQLYKELVSLDHKAFIKQIACGSGNINSNSHGAAY